MAGCGSREVAVYPASGTVRVEGRPAPGAMVALHPIGGGGEVSASAARPVAIAGADGAFRLTTCRDGDGAPEGSYAVTVVWPDDAGDWDACEDVARHDRLGGRYADPARSPWRVAIGPGANEMTLRADARADAAGPDP